MIDNKPVSLVKHFNFENRWSSIYSSDTRKKLSWLENKSVVHKIQYLPSQIEWKMFCVTSAVALNPNCIMSMAALFRLLPLYWQLLNKSCFNILFFPADWVATSKSSFWAASGTFLCGHKIFKNKANNFWQACYLKPWGNSRVCSKLCYLPANAAHLETWECLQC